MKTQMFAYSRVFWTTWAIHTGGLMSTLEHFGSLLSLCTVKAPWCPVQLTTSLQWFNWINMFSFSIRLQNVQSNRVKGILQTTSDGNV